MGEAPRQEHVVRKLGCLSPLKYGGCDGCTVPGILPPAICSGLGRTNCHLLFEKPKPAVALLNPGSYSHFYISNLPNISGRQGWVFPWIQLVNAALLWKSDLLWVTESDVRSSHGGPDLQPRLPLMCDMLGWLWRSMLVGGYSLHSLSPGMKASGVQS